MSTNDVVRTYELKHPIEVRNKETGDVVEKITQLELRRPKGKHLKKMDSATGEVGKTLALTAAIAGLPPSSLDDMDGEDFAEVGEIVASFFGGRLPTGQTSSET